MSHKNITNLDYLTSISFDNKNLVKSIIEIFIEQTPEYIKNLKNSIRNGEHDKINYLIHTLKGTFKIVGIEMLDEYVEKMEKNMRSTDLKCLETLVGDVENICNRAYVELKEKITSS